MAWAPWKTVTGLRWWRLKPSISAAPVLAALVRVPVNLVFGETSLSIPRRGADGFQDVAVVQTEPARALGALKDGDVAVGPPPHFDVACQLHRIAGI